MDQFANSLDSAAATNGELAVFWLGQAGFVFKTDKGTKIGLDLYLSDCCYRYFGFKRLMPMLVPPQELKLDILLATHAHYDHFDVDSVPLLLGNQCSFVGAKDCRHECDRLGIDPAQTQFLSPGEFVRIKDAAISAVKCDHGSGTPDAVGLLLEISGKRIYITGDTGYRPDFLKEELMNPDLLILPINGAFGNLDERQAAQYARLLHPKFTIPCHYWNFAEHGGNPYIFMEQMKKMEPQLCFNLMRMGECIVI